MPAATNNPADTFSALLALLALSSDTDASSKAVAGAKLASLGGQVAGVPGASTLGGAAGVAGTALTLADILREDDLSTFDKIGQGTGTAFDALASFTIPYYGPAKLVSGIGNALSRSGSPQVAGLGRALEHTGSPGGADIFAAGVRGHAPWEYLDTKTAHESFILDLLGPLGTIAKGMGKGDKVAEAVTNFGPVPFGGKALEFFAHEPTEGTKWRTGVANVFKRIPGFETFSGGADRTYNMDPETLAKFDPKDVAAATQLARLAAPAAARYGDKQSAYIDQVRNMLLNLYGHPGELTAKLPAALEYLLQPAR